MKSRFMAILILLLALLVLVIVPVSAHEEREVGAYDVELGWRMEPPYTGLLNGPEFFVHDHATGDPVTGLEDTLHLLVHLGDQEKMLTVYPVENDPGHYTADLIPTRIGDYTFHLFGKINDQDVDEQFTSADGYFDSVDPASDIMFPSLDTASASDSTASAQIADLQAQIDALKVQLEQLQGTQTP
ncbi:MAG: hypothetical protein GC204_01650 [Chloroflexi bacterium]|nr:hypothetical protein [Chloroflexota bacterium]